MSVTIDRRAVLNDKTSLSKVNGSKGDPKKGTGDVLVAHFEMSRKSLEIEVIER